MRPCRSTRPALALALLGLLAPGAASLLVLALAPASAFAQAADPYKQHMDNGIKLYQDGNYSAAIVEFQAAYEAKPKASPLLDIALCHKARFNYPKAIEALETALAKHADTMDAADKQAAESAISEMRALLAYVDVELSPPQATLVVDDEELPAGAARKPVPLGPGTHRVGARAEGYAAAEQTVTVASGDREKVKLVLAPDKGKVSVQAPNPRLTIAVDQRVVGAGQWSGLLTPGAHLVQIYGLGSAPFAAQVLVVAGKQIVVRPSPGGVPVPILPVTPPPAPAKKRSASPLVRSGPYGFVLGSILFPTSHPPHFTKPKLDFGAEYGLRGGYQINRIAGFDVSFQHSAITSTSGTDGSSYQAFANRLAIGLRLLSAGKWVRLAGAVGGGPVFDLFDFRKTNICNGAPATNDCPFKNSVSAFDAFMYLEGAVEIDLDRVLIDLGLEVEFQSTNGIGEGGWIFAGYPLVHVAPALRVGYRFW